MPSQNDYNDAFWLAYFDAIKAGWKPGPSTAIFFTQEGQLGPAAGPGISQKYTNSGIYQIADNMLRDDSVSYTPSQSNSYTKALLNFLNYVELDGDHSPTNEAYLTDKLEDQAAAQVALDKALDSALAQYTKLVNAGLVAKGTPFAQWAPVNAAAYNTASVQYQTASAEVLAAQARIGGPMSSQYQADKTNLTNAIYNNAALVPGLNMETSIETPASAAEIRRAQQKGEKIPEPARIIYVPQYTAPNYATMIASWISASGNSNPSWSKVDITFDKGKDIDKEHFGQKNISADVSVPTPWFSVSAGGGTSHQESSVLKSTDQQKTRVTVKWTDRQNISLNSGLWDIKNAAYKLKPDAPKMAGNLVRPTQLVCFNNLCFDITFEGETIEEVDTSVSDTVSGRASLRIFGWNIGVEGSSTNTDKTHTFKWDKQSGTLSLAPTQYGLSANFAAIIGEKVTRDVA